MAYRLTLSEKWSDPWFCNVSNNGKLLFFYLCDHCTIAGFYEINPKILNLYLPGILPETHILELNHSIVFKNGWAWVKNFVKHQKNLPLNPKIGCHRAIIRELLTHEAAFGEFYPKEFKGMLTPTMGLRKGTGIGNKDIERSEQSNNYIPKSKIKTNIINNSISIDSSLPPGVRGIDHKGQAILEPTPDELAAIKKANDDLLHH